MSFRRIVLRTALLSCFALQIGIQDGWAQYLVDPCLDAVTLDMGSLQVFDEAESSSTFRLPLPGPGAVAIDAMLPVSNSAQLRLELVGTNCRDAVSQLRVIDRSPGSLVIRAKGPGSVYVKVGSSKQVARFNSFTLHSAFAPEVQAPGVTMTLDSNPSAMCGTEGIPTIESNSEGYVLVNRPSGAEGDVEPEDCDVLELTAPTPGVIMIEATGGTFDASLFEGSDCSDPLTEGSLGDQDRALVTPVFAGRHRVALGSQDGLSLAYSLGIRHLPLCPVDSGHDGLLRCGRVLEIGKPAHGTLKPGQEQAFTFQLDALMSVGVTLSGNFFEGALFDSRGLRLASALNCGSNGCSLEAVLPKGRYGFRLASRTAEETPYLLALAPVSLD